MPTNNARKEVEKYNRRVIDPEKVGFACAVYVSVPNRSGNLQIARRQKRVTDKRMKLQKKLQELGIEYDVIDVRCNRI